MQTLDNIERIPVPSAEAFLREHVLPCRPVILTDLFDDQPIRALDTAEALRARLPDLPIAVRPNYLTTAQGVDAEVHQTTLERFLDYVAAHPDTPNLCIEYPTPPQLAALIEPPAHCRVIDETDLISLIFFAAPGNFVHLHLDGDQRHTVMYQAFGRKRYSIIDTRELGKVLPQDDRNSSLMLEHFDEDDKLAFLRYANGWDCLLEPGETLLIPMLAWHYVEYVDVSLSISFRLGRNRFNRFLAETVPITSPYMQRVARAFADEARVDAERAALFARLERVSRRDHGSREARALALDRCCMEICEELDDGVPAAPYTLFDQARRQRLESAPAAAGPDDEPQEPPRWADADIVALRPGVMVLTSLAEASGAARGVVLARYGRLELRLAIDARRPWLLELLRALAAPSASFTVAELAARCGASTSELRAVLAQLYDRGWVIAGAGVEPAVPA